MNARLVVKIILVIGLLVVMWWLFKLALKLFIPILVIAGGVYVWYKYIRPKK